VPFERDAGSSTIVVVLAGVQPVSLPVAGSTRSPDPARRARRARQRSTSSTLLPTG
jgi:hypothetical protein